MKEGCETVDKSMEKAEGTCAKEIEPVERNPEKETESERTSANEKKEADNKPKISELTQQFLKEHIEYFEDNVVATPEMAKDR